MSLIRKISINLLIVFLSCCVGVVCFELFYRFGFQLQPVYHYDSRYMLFQGTPNPEVFKNIGSIFVYEPNQVISSETYYDQNSHWIQEYKYRIHTNNLGLVQKEQINLKSPSVLVLGDSFTEGQGVGPWITRLKNSAASRMQFINGGLLGTRFAQ